MLANLFKGLLKREEGQTLAEYSLIIFFIAIACILALTALGVNLAAILQGLADTLAGL